MTGDIREIVKQKYAQAITQKRSCCGNGGQNEATQQVTGNLYQSDDVNGLPAELIAASFGCGNPTALGNLYAGEVVLDLGSGAGLDVLLSARRVGPAGKAYGLDMTDEMLEAARQNQKEAGINNAEFLKGHIEEIPLPDQSVDVVISNCVINLSGDKDQVMREMFRVLKPGGRVAVSDIIAKKPLPYKVRQDLLAWAGCVAGALTEKEYRCKLLAAGFENVEVVVTRVYDLTSVAAQQFSPNLSQLDLEEINGTLVSAFIRAKKPVCFFTLGKDYMIRSATVNDLPAIERLLIMGGLPIVGIDHSINNFLVADNGEMVGVIGVEYGKLSALLRSFVVHPEQRKRGVASELVHCALDNLKANGIKKVIPLPKPILKLKIVEYALVITKNTA